MGSVAVGLNLTGASGQFWFWGQFFHPDAIGHTRSSQVSLTRLGTRGAGRLSRPELEGSGVVRWKQVFRPPRAAAE